MGKGRKVSLWDYIAASSAALPMIPIGTGLNEIEIEDGSDPESILIRVEHEQEIDRAYNGLSEEAKELIATILDGPKDVVDQMRTDTLKIITKKQIRKYLTKQWGDKGFVDNLIDEITRFVKLFGNN